MCVCVCVCVKCKVHNLGADGMMMMMINSSMKLSPQVDKMEIIVVIFGVIDQLLFRYCVFVK